MVETTQGTNVSAYSAKHVDGVLHLNLNSPKHNTGPLRVTPPLPPSIEAED